MIKWPFKLALSAFFLLLRLVSHKMRPTIRMKTHFQVIFISVKIIFLHRVPLNFSHKNHFSDMYTIIHLKAHFVMLSSFTVCFSCDTFTLKKIFQSIIN